MLLFISSSVSDLLFKERFTNHDFIKITSPYEEKRK